MAFTIQEINYRFNYPNFQGLNNFYLNENHLQCMTDGCLETTVTTKFLVFYLGMLCQAFGAATFSCCLFVGLSAFGFAFTR